MTPPDLQRMSPLIVGGVLATMVIAPTLIGSAALAAPGTPGVPQAGIVLLDEGFQNVAGPSPIIKLDEYVGANGETYTADAAWLANCNGWITSTSQDSSASAPPTVAGECNDQNGWNSTQQLAHALGVFNGLDPAQGGQNYAVSAYTQANPGAGLVEFETVDNIALPAAGRYVKFSVDIAALNCAIASAPMIQFSALDDEGAATPLGGVINGCSSTTSVAIPAVGVASAGSARVGTYGTGAALLVEGPSVGVRLVNTNGSGGGNDHAFDNVRILDVTPQLDKTFTPSTIGVGETSVLRFTITNTAELDAKNGWSYTDTLPAGLTVAGSATTDCPASSVTAVAGSATIAVSGNLTQGLASCVVSVPVKATSPGTYTNGASNIAGVGVNPPATATLVVAAKLAATGSDSTGALATGVVALALGAVLMGCVAVRRRARSAE